MIGPACYPPSSSFVASWLRGFNLSTGGYCDSVKIWQFFIRFSISSSNVRLSSSNVRSMAVFVSMFDVRGPSWLRGSKLSRGGYCDSAKIWLCVCFFVDFSFSISGV